MSANKKVPPFLQSALWSYNLNALDLNNPKDRKIIIEQVLNYGTQDQLDWLLGNFTENDMKRVIQDPSRGVWHKDSLDYWLKILDMKLPQDKYKKALFNLNPQNGSFKYT